MAVERKRIGLREVRGLEPGKIVWDKTVVGFGARRQKGESVSYFIKYRTKEGRQRWHGIGRHGSPWTPDTARERAVSILGEVAGGADPAADKRANREAKTVAELVDMPESTTDRLARLTLLTQRQQRAWQTVRTAG